MQAITINQPQSRWQPMPAQDLYFKLPQISGNTQSLVTLGTGEQRFILLITYLAETQGTNGCSLRLYFCKALQVPSSEPENN